MKKLLFVLFIMLASPSLQAESNSVLYLDTVATDIIEVSDTAMYFEDSIWMYGNRNWILRQFDEILHVNTPISFKLEGHRELQKAKFWGMLNADVMLLKVENGDTQQLALSNVVKIRKDGLAKKIYIGGAGAFGVLLTALGTYYIIEFSPNGLGVVFGTLVLAMGSGALMGSAYMLLNSEFKLHNGNFIGVKIAKKDLANHITPKLGTKLAMNRALRHALKGSPRF